MMKRLVLKYGNTYGIVGIAPDICPAETTWGSQVFKLLSVEPTYVLYGLKDVQCASA